VTKSTDAGTDVATSPVHLTARHNRAQPLTPSLPRWRRQCRAHAVAARGVTTRAPLPCPECGSAAAAAAGGGGGGAGWRRPLGAVQPEAGLEQTRGLWRCAAPVSPAE